MLGEDVLRPIFSSAIAAISRGHTIDLQLGIWLWGRSSYPAQKSDPLWTMGCYSLQVPMQEVANCNWILLELVVEMIGSVPLEATSSLQFFHLLVGAYGSFFPKVHFHIERSLQRTLFFTCKVSDWKGGCFVNKATNYLDDLMEAASHGFAMHQNSDYQWLQFFENHFLISHHLILAKIHLIFYADDDDSKGSSFRIHYVYENGLQLDVNVNNQKSRKESSFLFSLTLDKAQL